MTAQESLMLGAGLAGSLLWRSHYFPKSCCCCCCCCYTQHTAHYPTLGQARPWSPTEGGRKQPRTWELGESWRPPSLAFPSTQGEAGLQRQKSLYKATEGGRKELSLDPDPSSCALSLTSAASTSEGLMKPGHRKGGDLERGAGEAEWGALRISYPATV